MSIKYIALPTQDVLDLVSGLPDANGKTSERVASDGEGNPCRHCLQEIPLGEEMLVLAYRPFKNLQPYAEVGPIFLCAAGCERYPETSIAPEHYKQREMLVRGYDAEDRIVYGTGKVIPVPNLEKEALSLLEVPRVKYLHARSPTNNCYHFKIEVNSS